MRFSKKTYYILIIILLFTIPILVNHLMSFKVTKVYGDTNTWIGFLGSYIGAIISGIVTVFGVLLTIKFTREESKKDKLPEKINNLEECLDYLEDVLEDLDKLRMNDLSDVLYRKPSDRAKLLFDVDANYLLVKRENFNDFIKTHVKKIRGYTVKVDTQAYQAFRKFTDKLDTDYKNSIGLIESSLRGFQMHVIDNYMETHDMIITSNNHKLDEIDLDEEDAQRIEKLKSDLYYKESDYIYELDEAYYQLKNALEDILVKLTDDFDR
ncbi:hypothetical protein P4640_19245 [Priestia aryabhattai]|uniref:hypothetical protein n=1 Tax=Priestia aryabhattai TaxID=412384 RepID=UPI002E1C4D82|nr:hypothetical protein [Priestia aryabhattai]